MSGGHGGGSQRPGAFPGLLLPGSRDSDGQVVCKEKKVFYRLISGIHASITAHIAAEHPKEICDGAGGNAGGGNVGGNLFSSHAKGLQSARPADARSPFQGFGGAQGGRGGGHDDIESEPGCRLDERHWGPNLRLFYDRLGKKELKARVENLYFV